VRDDDEPVERFAEITSGFMKTIFKEEITMENAIYKNSCDEYIIWVLEMTDVRCILINKYSVLQYHDSGKLACSKAFRHIVKDEWGW